MYLSDGKKETQYIVKDIGLPTGIEKRLEALGMTRGTSVTVLNSKSKGILIVKVRGTRFALGRNITEHISVAAHIAGHFLFHFQQPFQYLHHLRLAEAKDFPVSRKGTNHHIYFPTLKSLFNKPTYHRKFAKLKEYKF